MSRATRLVYGTIDLVYALVLAGILLGALPERHRVVDALGGAASLLLLAAGLALVANVAWAVRMARIACVVLVVTGTVLLAGIVSSVGFLYGIYGAVGELGVSVLLVLAALAVPYFIVFPLLQFAHLRAPAQELSP